MNKNIFFLIIIFVLIYYCSYKIENLEIDSTQKGDTKKIEILDDTLFNDVVTYHNDDDPYSENGKIGLEKCLDNCIGNCVEFGVTGTTLCFPSEKK